MLMESIANSTEEDTGHWVSCIDGALFTILRKKELVVVERKKSADGNLVSHMIDTTLMRGRKRAFQLFFNKKERAKGRE